MSYVNKSEDLKSLKNALSLYTQTTDALIKNFVATQNKQDKLMPGEEDRAGEVSVQIGKSNY